MTPILLQNAAGTITFYLSTTAGAPATGITFSSVTAGLKKEGETAFTPFTVNSGNWHEIGLGYYYINLVSGNTNIIGNLYLSLTISGVDPTLLVGYVAASVTPPLGPTPTLPSTSTISGFLVDIEGNALSGASISFKLLGAPISIGTVGFTTSVEVVKSDSNGYFSLDLIQGLSVDVSIPAINYRRTIVVPSTDSNLFEVP